MSRITKATSYRREWQASLIERAAFELATYYDDGRWSDAETIRVTYLLVLTKPLQAVLVGTNEVLGSDVWLGRDGDLYYHHDFGFSRLDLLSCGEARLNEIYEWLIESLAALPRG